MRIPAVVIAASLLVACSGTNGSDGAAGPIGPTGPVGPTGAEGKPGLTWRGAWDGATAYAGGDVVQSGGSAYVTGGAVSGVQPPGAPWQLLAASSVAQTVDVAQVVAPVTVAEVTAPVAVSAIAAPVEVSAISQPVTVSGVSQPVAVSGISQPVAVSSIQSPVSVTGVVRVDADSPWGIPVRLASSYSTLPVSVSGGVSVSNMPTVTTRDFESNAVRTGDNSGGTVVPCPASIAPLATTCRRVSTRYGYLFLTDLVVTALDDAPTAARTAFAYAAPANDSTTPRWKVALRYVQGQGGTYTPVTGALTGARLAVQYGDSLYLADSGDALITWTTVSP